MLTEVLLAYLHLACILGWVVFVTSQAALARADWLNGAVVDRLVRVDVILWICWAAVLVSGLARTLWGVKGLGWYWSQPLLHAKVALLLTLGLAAWPNTRTLRQWQQRWHRESRLPPPAEIDALRRRVMVAAHAMLLIPLLGQALARGVFTR
jgi:putative membrane protein